MTEDRKCICKYHRPTCDCEDEEMPENGGFTWPAWVMILVIIAIASLFRWK